MKRLISLLFTLAILHTSFSPSHAATPVLFDAGNGTIVDTANNLTWLRNASCFGSMNWNSTGYSTIRGTLKINSGKVIASRIKVMQ